MIKDNFSITKLFMDKDITIFVDTKTFTVRTHSVREFYENNTLNSVYHLLTSTVKDLQKLYVVPIKTSLEAIQIMIFDLGRYGRYMDIANKIREILPIFLPEINIDMSQHEISVNGITMTEEI